MVYTDDVGNLHGKGKNRDYLLFACKAIGLGVNNGKM